MLKLVLCSSNRRHTSCCKQFDYWRAHQARVCRVEVYGLAPSLQALLSEKEVTLEDGYTASPVVQVSHPMQWLFSYLRRCGHCEAMFEDLASLEAHIDACAGNQVCSPLLACCLFTNKVNTLRASPQCLSWLEIIGTRNTCSATNIFNGCRVVW